MSTGLRLLKLIIVAFMAKFVARSRCHSCRMGSDDSDDGISKVIWEDIFRLFADTNPIAGGFAEL